MISFTTILLCCSRAALLLVVRTYAHTCVSLDVALFQSILTMSSASVAGDGFCVPHRRAQESVTLRIGYHELTGKIEKLKKPLAVMEKHEGKKKEEEEGEGRDATGNLRYRKRGRTEAETSYEIVGLIRRKIAFVTRPKVRHPRIEILSSSS